MVTLEGWVFLMSEVPLYPNQGLLRLLSQFISGPDVVQIWSRNTLELKGNETLELHRVDTFFLIFIN